jgi:hypothetical protein
MATGIDSPTDRVDAQRAPTSQGAIDEVHRLRTAKPTDPSSRGGTAPIGQEIAFGDFQKLYGKEAVAGAVAPVQMARADAPVHEKAARAVDGQPQLVRPADASSPVTDRTHVPAGAERTNAEARESLLNAARDKYKNDPKALEAFQQDMNTFEKRMSKWPTLAPEIGRTYGQIEKLLNGHSIDVSDKERVKIAGQVMHQVAKPQINQGNSEDCLAASLETRLYERAPSQAAKLMADMTLNGGYETTDHRTIRLDQGTIANYRPEVANAGQEPRSHASQIMQAVLRNIELDKINQEGTTDLRYEIHPPGGLLDNGERVMDYSKHPAEDVSKTNLGMRFTDAEAVYDKVAGTKDNGFSTYFYSHQNSDEFKRALDEMARKGKFPATIGVNLLQEPFMSQGGGPWAAVGAAIMSNGMPMHAVTINSYDPRTGKIEYTNHVNGSETHSISRDDLFKTMFQPALPGYVDVLAKGINEEMKKDPSVKANVEHNISTLLTFMQPDQRKQVLEELSQKTGLDLQSQLTREERARLGVESGVFDFLTHPFYQQ